MTIRSRAARWGVATAVVVTASLALPMGAEAATTPLSATDQRIRDRLVARDGDYRLGSDWTGFVTDAASGRMLYSHDRGERQLPASNTKIATAVNALQAYGPAHRFTTRTVKGTYWSQVVLVGAGDPSLSSGDLDALATSTAAAVRARGLRRVAVHVDDSLFPAPSLAYGWKSSYVPTDVRPVRALVVNRHEVWDTSMDAGNVFAAKLALHGVSVRAVVRKRAPAGSPQLAAVRGDTLRSIVGYLLRTSDNDDAEALHRLVAHRLGYPTTWSGARAAQAAALARLGVPLGTSRLYDGSGLSRADRLTGTQLVAMLGKAFDGDHPRLAPLQDGALAVAGRTGTLAARYKRYTTWPTSCAVGLIQAKTGSLSGVITLSGFARGRDGRIKLFSFLLNGVDSTLTTRQAVDRLATTITGCW